LELVKKVSVLEMKKMLENWQYLLVPVFFFSLHSFSHDVVVVQAGGDVQGECVVSYSKIKKRAIYAKKTIARVQ
jgi:hypothetical protein